MPPMRPSSTASRALPLSTQPPLDQDHEHIVSVIEPDDDHVLRKEEDTDNARPRSDATSSSEPDVLAGLLSPLPPAIPRPPPHTRHFSAHSHSQQSLTDEKSLHRNSWALTDGSHAAHTTESHPSKRPLLGRSRSSGVGGTDTFNSRMDMDSAGGTVSRQQQRTMALLHADEFGGRRRRGSRSASWDEDARRRRARFQGAKVGLEIFIAAWAAYSLVRHFLGYTLYTSDLDRRIISLVLGSLSLASLFICIASLFLVSLTPSPPPELLGPFLELLLVTFQLTPPITSFVLVFLWRNAPQPNKTLAGRCSWDIDVVWTGTGSQCTGGTGPQWATFVAASSVRLALTVIILAVYTYVCTQFRRTPKPLRRRTSGTGGTTTLHQRPSRPDSDAQTGPTISMDSRAQLVSFAQKRHSSSGGGGTTPTPINPSGSRNSPRHMLADEFTPPTTPGANMNMGYADSGAAAMISSSPSYPPAPHPTQSTSSYNPYATSSPGEPSSSSHPHPSSSPSSSTNPYSNFAPSNPYSTSNPYSFTSDPDSNSPLPSPSESQDPDAAAAAIAARLARRTADMELIQFAAQFRSLVHQMQRDVAAGALYPSNSAGPSQGAGGTGTTWGGWTGAGWTGPAGDSAGSSAGTPSSDGDGMTPRSDDGRDDYGFPITGPLAGPSSGYGYNYGQGQGYGQNQGQGQWSWSGPGPSPLAFNQQLSNPSGPATRLAPEEREQMRLVLGRLVRRMPTIESLGSREGAGSSIHRSGTGPYSSASATASRPPTRMTMRSATNTDAGSFVSSAPPSRSNSLTLGRAVQGQGATAPLPTPPSPVVLDGGYFSARASSPVPHGHRGAAQQAPSRPPTPTDSAYGTPMTTSATATTSNSGSHSHSGPNTASNSSAGHSPAMGWSLTGFSQAGHQS